MISKCLVTLNLEHDISATLDLPRIPVAGDRIELADLFCFNWDESFIVTKVHLFPRNHRASQQGTVAWVIVQRLREEDKQSTVEPSKKAHMLLIRAAKMCN